MVHHIVMWKFKPEIEENKKEELKKAMEENLTALVGKIPGQILRDYRGNTKYIIPDRRKSVNQNFLKVHLQKTAVRRNHGGVGFGDEHRKRRSLRIAPAQPFQCPAA